MFRYVYVFAAILLVKWSCACKWHQNCSRKQ